MTDWSATFNNFLFFLLLFFRMVLSSVTLIKITIVTFCLVTVTEQHWKWHKPYALDGPPKYSHSSVYKPKSLTLKPLQYSPSREKPYSPAHDKPHAPAHEKPYPHAHEKPYPHARERLYTPGHEKSFKQDQCELRKVIFTQDAESPQVRTPRARSFLFVLFDDNNIRSPDGRHTFFSEVLTVG